MAPSPSRSPSGSSDQPKLSSPPRTPVKPPSPKVILSVASIRPFPADGEPAGSARSGNSAAASPSRSSQRARARGRPSLAPLECGCGAGSARGWESFQYYGSLRSALGASVWRELRETNGNGIDELDTSLTAIVLRYNKFLPPDIEITISGDYDCIVWRHCRDGKD